MISLAIGLPVLIGGLMWLVFFSPRPPVTTDAAILAGDGSTLDYCQLPELTGRGKQSHDIAKGNTPGCGYDHFPCPYWPIAPRLCRLKPMIFGVSGLVSKAVMSVMLSASSNVGIAPSSRRRGLFMIMAPTARPVSIPMTRKAV